MIKKEIFSDNLPKWKEGTNKEKTNWKESVGYKVKFIYDDIEGYIQIVDYIKVKGKEPRLKIKYIDKEFIMSVSQLISCGLGKILNKQTKEFKIEVGTTFKDNKRNITITDRKYIKDKKGQMCKYYKYKCNKCGFDGGKHFSLKYKCYKNEYWILERNLLSNNDGCACCNQSQIIVKGINDIATTNPNLVEYFINIEDAYTHSYNSRDEVLIKCPNCKTTKPIVIYNLCNRNNNCSICSDGMSYPEKIMFNLLEQLKNKNKINNYINQYSKNNAEWCDKYKYDFYFKLNDEEYIIETNGLQHYKYTGFKRTLEEEQQNDKYKYNLAIKNGIKEENYIVIDCRYSELEYIKNNILNSKLNYIFDLSDIDWNEINKKSQKSLIKEVCNYWYLHVNINNEELTVTDLENIFNLKKDTIRKYIKQGEKLNWCYYNPKEEIIKSNYKLIKKVMIFKNGVPLVETPFKSCNDLAYQSEKLFGIKLNPKSISKVCRGDWKQYKGYTFKYV